VTALNGRGDGTEWGHRHNFTRPPAADPDLPGLRVCECGARMLPERGARTRPAALDVALDVTVPGYVSHFPAGGVPHAGDVHPYRGGLAVDVDLGEFLARGFGPDKPRVTVTAPGVCLLLMNAFLDAYAKLTLAGAP
jgi:hypothetical protein